MRGKVIPGETIGPYDFTREMRKFAQWTFERCDALDVKEYYPDALQIMAADDEELMIIQIHWTFTKDEFKKIREGLENNFLDYLIGAYVAKRTTIVQSETSPTQDSPVRTGRTESDASV